MARRSRPGIDTDTPSTTMRGEPPEPKPEFLGPEFAAPFQERGVVGAYLYRPPYPPELFDMLVGLIRAEPRVVLDVGCGTGNIARPLAPRVERVDAVDVSAAMIERGQRLPGGDSPALRWMCGRAEDAPLHPPYALITAGASLHWMDWDIVLPRFQGLLVPGGYLVIIHQDEATAPWTAAVRELIRRYSTNPHHRPVDLSGELERRRMFRKHGEARTVPVRFSQPLDEYVESHHSMSRLTRERMGAEAAAAFDRELTAAVAPHCRDGRVELELVVSVVWGQPVSP
jgi:SAM-dependent methyltransferase